MTSGDITSAGLWFDVIGAFFLTKSIVSKKREEIAREAGTYFGGNVHLLRSSSYQTIQARAGFIFLLVGSVGQLLGQTGWFRFGQTGAQMLIFIGAVVLFGLSVFLIGKFSRRYSRRMVTRVWEPGIRAELADDSRSPEKKMESALRFGTWLDLRPKPGEQNQTFIARNLRSVYNWSRTAMEPR